MLDISQVILVRTDSNLCRNELKVHWSAPNSLIRSYLQPCTNSMWGDESEAVAPIIWLYQTVDAQKEEVSFPNLLITLRRYAITIPTPTPIRWQGILCYNSAVVVHPTSLNIKCLINRFNRCRVFSHSWGSKGRMRFPVLISLVIFHIPWHRVIKGRQLVESCSINEGWLF